MLCNLLDSKAYTQDTADVIIYALFVNMVHTLLPIDILIVADQQPIPIYTNIWCVESSDRQPVNMSFGINDVNKTVKMFTPCYCSF